MGMNKPVDRLIRLWSKAGLEIRPGVSVEQLTQFEQQFETKLRQDMREYLMAVDGMAPDDMDPNCHIRFWPICEIKPVQDEVHASCVSQYKGYYLFADYLLWSHGYAIDLNSTDQGSVVIVGGETPQQVAMSFADFVHKYLDNTEQIF